MPQFSTTSTIYEVFYLENTNLNLGNLTYSFKDGSSVVSVTPTLYKFGFGWYAFSFSYGTQTQNLNLTVRYSSYFYATNYIIGSSEYSETQTGKHYFRVNLGRTGLIAGDVTIRLYENQVLSGVSVNFAEDSNFFYDLDFTSTANGFWFLTLEYDLYRILINQFVGSAPAGGGTTINVQASTTNQVSASSSNYTIVRASS